MRNIYYRIKTDNISGCCMQYIQLVFCYLKIVKLIYFPVIQRIKLYSLIIGHLPKLIDISFSSALSSLNIYDICMYSYILFIYFIHVFSMIVFLLKSISQKVLPATQFSHNCARSLRNRGTFANK